MDAGVRWGELASTQPDLADAGRGLLYQFGVGLAMLATVRRDGAPRVHPICVQIVGDGLYAYLERSYKQGDLLHDGRYALHCFPPAVNEDKLYVSGRARLVEDPAVVAAVDADWLAARGVSAFPPEWDGAGHRLFELLIDRCLHTTTKGHGDWHPQHTVWRAL